MVNLENYEDALRKIHSDKSSIFDQVVSIAWLVQNVPFLIAEVKSLRGTREVVEDDPQKFAEIWNSSRSVSEAAQRLGLPYQTTHSRACRYKQFYNLNLKRFRKVNQ